MTNLLLLILIFLVFQLFLLWIYNYIYSNNKDSFILSLSTLERVIDDYMDAVLEKKIKSAKRNYNLDPESKVNSILAFEKKVNEIISESSLEVMKLLSRRTLKILRRHFSDKSLALLIINRIKQQNLI